MKTIVFLYASTNDARSGLRSGGTGFLFRVPAQRVVGHFDYVITNKHVVEAGARTIRFNGKDGIARIVEVDRSDWILHPSTDLAMTFVSITDEMDVMHINESFVCSHQMFLDLDVGVGDDVVIPSRLVGVDGITNNRPLMRFGRIASNDVYPVMSTGGVTSESLLVEATSIRGMSGAPVFLGVSDLFLRPNAKVPVESRVWLIGVQYGFVRHEIPANVGTGFPLTINVEVNTGIMCVVPVWIMWEFLNSSPVLDKKNASEDEGIRIGMPLRS